MPWTYRQSTGVLGDPHGQYVATGYSGADAGKNNPLMEGEKDIGPILAALTRFARRISRLIPARFPWVWQLCQTPTHLDAMHF